MNMSKGSINNTQDKELGSRCTVTGNNNSAPVRGSNSANASGKDRTEVKSNHLDDENAINSFDNMGLKDSLLRGVYSEGFETPSYIQARGIMPIALGKDTFGQAQSGTGKTGAFLIGSLQRLKDDVHRTQILVLAPTRELAR